jgi:hypothetical protein
MSDDLLREATRALADSAEPSGETAAFTRARVMRDVHRDTRRRVSRTLVLVPVAAVLMGATAAAATGGLSSTWKHVVALVSGERIGPDETPATPSPIPPPAPIARAAAAPPTESAAPVEPAPEPPPEPVPSATASVARSVPAPSAHVDAGSAAEERELSLYRTAHHTHFVEHDYAKALAAWDQYLANAPRGRFGAEAQYNRAICLARLGRSAEAERALGPFAEGRYGSYRKDEAARLISALRADASKPTESQENPAP